MTELQDSTNLPAFNSFVKYQELLKEAISTVDDIQFELAASTLEDAMITNKQIFVCGNGGSAAIAEHMTCDHCKGVSTDTNLFPKVISLSSNMSLITAIANDISYDEVFSKQLMYLGNKGDVLVCISSSGNSKNIVRAIETAQMLDMYVIALTGFDGGQASKIANIPLHVNMNNYGVVEDCHQSIMHSLAQYIRVRHLDAHDKDIIL